VKVGCPSTIHQTKPYLRQQRTATPLRAGNSTEALLSNLELFDSPRADTTLVRAGPRFAEEKIISNLKELEAGAKAAELARKYGVSDVTIYNWKGRYGGMEVSQLRRLKELESENARLKRMYADRSLTHQALQDVVEKSCNRLRSQ
jgi:putative transposase